MSPDVITWIWFVIGLALMVLELFLPGLVVCFLGLGAVLVACLRWIGLFLPLEQSILAWFITSIALLLGLRHLLVRYLPADKSYSFTDEDVEAAGMIVDVTREVISGESSGRVRYAGTTWPAVTREGKIPAGQKAKLLYRENLVWSVEPCAELPKAEGEIETQDKPRDPEPKIRN